MHYFTNLQLLSKSFLVSLYQNRLGKYLLSTFISFLFLVLPAIPTTAQTVTDSIRVTRSVATWALENGTCAAGVIGTWPDAAARVLNQETTYRTYRLVVVDGSFIPRGNGEIVPSNGFFDEVPDGYYGHDPRLPGGSGPCKGFGELVAAANARVATGATFPLNGAQYTMGDWYATYEVPDGTPVAEFIWSQTEGLTVAFDGSFERELSREVTEDGPVPVESYEWDFGDESKGTGATPQYTYAEPGTYSVSLTVTDDDGETDTATYEVDVAGAILNYSVTVPESVVPGDTLRVEIDITNTGTVDAAEVTILRDLALVPSYPTNPTGFRRNAQPSAPLFGSGDTTITTGIAVGATLQIEQAYVIEQAAWVNNGGTITEVPVDWKAQIESIRGEDIAGREAKTSNVCLDDSCDDTVRIQPILPPELFVSTVANPDTIGVGGAFDLLVIVRNGGEGPAENITADGPLIITSQNGGAATIISGPEPETLERLEPEERDTLVYRLEAEALGTLEFEVPIVGEDLAGEEVTATPECIVSDGILSPKFAAKTDDLAPSPCGVKITKTIVVTTTGDEENPTASMNADVCDVDPNEDGNQCTLRAAIMLANQRKDVLQIRFNIQGELPHIITAETSLPAIVTPYVIDATTQPGYIDSPVIQLVGSGVDIGLSLEAGDTKVRGFSIVDFEVAAIYITGEGRNTIEACYLGVEIDGITARPNGDGVLIDSSFLNIIGGSDPSDGNLIVPRFSPVEGDPSDWYAGVRIKSQFAFENVIAGNLIGTTADGTTQLNPDSEGGGVGVLVLGSDGNVIGGDTPSPGQAPGNVIAGLDTGVIITQDGNSAAEENRIVGNLIGTNRDGTAPLPNTVGITLEGLAPFTAIGDDAPGTRNVLVGTDGGINVSDFLYDDGQPAEGPIGSRIVNNLIGLDVTGTRALGAQLYGVAVGSGASLENLSPGARGISVGDKGAPPNFIAGHTNVGVLIFGTGHEVYEDPDASEEKLAASYVIVRNNRLGLNTSGEIVSTTSGERSATGISVMGGQRAFIGYENAGNMIGGHNLGVELQSEESIVAANYIGIDPSGEEARPNAVGVFVSGSGLLGFPPEDDAEFSLSFIRTWGNVIAGNEDAGVLVSPINGDDTPEAVLIGNRIGLSASGKSLPNGTSFEPIPEMDTGGGVAVIGALSEADLIWNEISGNEGDGVINAGGNVSLVYNAIGTAFGEHLGDPLPNTRDGVHVYDGVLLAGEYPNKGPLTSSQVANLIASNGRHGIAAEAGAIVGLGANQIGGNGGLGIDLGVNGPSDELVSRPVVPVVRLVETDGSAVVKAQVVLPDEVTADGELLGTNLLVYNSNICDPSGYGEGEIFASQVPRQTPGGTIDVELDPENVLFGSYITMVATQVNEVGGIGPIPSSPIYESSEFSGCIRVALANEIAEAEINSNDIGEVLSDVGITVTIVSNSKEKQVKQLKHNTPKLSNQDEQNITVQLNNIKSDAGTLYASRFKIAPHHNLFEGSGISSDGTTVTADTISGDRYWSLKALELNDLTYDVCLNITDVNNVTNPNQLLVLHRSGIGDAWTPSTTTWDGDQLCAGGFTSFGDFGIGGSKNIFTSSEEVSEPEIEIPSQISLEQNYPNPFNPTTVIPFSLTEPGHVQLSVYDLLGRRVRTLVDEMMSAGRHDVSFDAGMLSTGIYIFQLNTGSERITRKMMLIK